MDTLAVKSFPAARRAVSWRLYNSIINHFNSYFFPSHSSFYSAYMAIRLTCHYSSTHVDELCVLELETMSERRVHPTNYRRTHQASMALHALLSLFISWMSSFYCLVSTPNKYHFSSSSKTCEAHNHAVVTAGSRLRRNTVTYLVSSASGNLTGSCIIWLVKCQSIYVN